MEGREEEEEEIEDKVDKEEEEECGLSSEREIGLDKEPRLRRLD